MEDTDLEEADAKQAEELEGVVVLGRAQIGEFSFAGSLWVRDR